MCHCRGLCALADVPLYPAKLVWLQLSGETKSRINACASGAGKGVRVPVHVFCAQLTFCLQAIGLDIRITSPP